MTEAVEFDVPEAGAPVLGDEASPYDEQAAAQQPVAPPVVAGWSQEEASQVVGGMVANLTIVMYAMRWHAPPPMELAPVIAGDPKAEFPLMGMGLAPILDFVAPKGSAAAIGVSLTAGIGELVGGIARRSPVLNVAPQQAQQRPAPQPQQPAQPPPAAEGGFRYSGDALRVLQGEGAYDAMGVGV